MTTAVTGHRQHEGHTVGGIARVERHVGSPGSLDPNEGDHQIDRPVEKHPDPVPGRDPDSGQMRCRASRAERRIELVEGEGPAIRIANGDPSPWAATVGRNAGDQGARRSETVRRSGRDPTPGARRVPEDPITSRSPTGTEAGPRWPPATWRTVRPYGRSRSSANSRVLYSQASRMPSPSSMAIRDRSNLAVPLRNLKEETSRSPSRGSDTPPGLRVNITWNSG